MPNIEIYATYDGAPDNAKELDMFTRLKGHAASVYPRHIVASSRFEVTEVEGVQRHWHFLLLHDPNEVVVPPADASA